MVARIFCILAVSLPAVAQAPQEDWREPMRQMLRNLREADAELGEYSYERVNVRRLFDSSGAATSERKTVLRREFFPGENFWVMRQVLRDGKAVPEEESERSLEKARKEFASMSAAERAKRDAENRQRRLEENDWLRSTGGRLSYWSLRRGPDTRHPTCGLACFRNCAGRCGSTGPTPSWCASTRKSSTQ
jgi:hypothetical protein